MVVKIGRLLTKQPMVVRQELTKYTYPRLKLQELWVSPLENPAPTVIKLVAGTGTST